MSDNFSNNKRIAKNTIFLYARMLVVLMINLYTSRVILKNLGVEDFGIYNVVAGFVTMFAFLNSSLSACIQRFYNYEKGRDGEDGVHRVYITSCFIQVILAIVVVLLVETVGGWCIEHKLQIPPERLNAAKYLFQCSTISMVIVILQVPFLSAVMAYEKMNYYAIVGIIDVLLKLSIVLILPLLTFDRLVSYGLLLIGVSIVDFTLYAAYSFKKFTPIKGPHKFDKGLFKEMLSFSSWSILGSFTQIMRDQGVNMILNVFWGPIVNAARGISIQIRSALVGFMGNIVVAARPQIVESYAEGNIARAKDYFFSISKISYILILMLVLPVSYEIDFILDLWLGKNVPPQTADFAVVVLATALVEILNWPVTTYIYAVGKIARYNVYTSIIGLMVLPLSYTLLHFDFPAISVFYASLLISLMVQIASIFILKRDSGVAMGDYLAKVVKPVLIVTLITFALPFLWVSNMPSTIYRALITVLVSVVSISVVSYFFALNSSERGLIRDYVSKIFMKYKS